MFQVFFWIENILIVRYGYENLIKRIWEKSGFNWRAHVSWEKFDNYLCEEQLGEW